MRNIFDCEDGQALVEMALSLSILILILLGVVEFARIGYSYVVVVHASREGARVGALRNPDHQIYSAVNESLGSLGDVPITVSISPPEDGRIRREPVHVGVTVELPLITPLGGLLPNPFLIEGKTVMRIE